jgi:hypothetical protein
MARFKRNVMAEARKSATSIALQRWVHYRQGRQSLVTALAVQGLPLLLASLYPERANQALVTFCAIGPKRRPCNGAKTFRLKLSARAVGADKAAPYTSIFPKGIAYYTAAPISDNVARYRELLTRATTGLPTGDEALAALQQSLPELIDLYAKAVTELDAARTKAALARTELEVSIDNWSVQLEKTYGVLTSEVTRAGADRFFPRASSSRVVEEPSATAPAEG